MLNIKINNNYIFAGIIFTFHFFHILSIVITDGYPQTNDILHLFKITPLEGNLKFINGIYGPGYTYYSLIFSNSLNIAKGSLIKLGTILISLLKSSAFFLSLPVKSPIVYVAFFKGF